MSNFPPQNPGFEQVIRASFAKQQFMRPYSARSARPLCRLPPMSDS